MVYEKNKVNLNIVKRKKKGKCEQIWIAWLFAEWEIREVLSYWIYLLSHQMRVMNAEEKWRENENGKMNIVGKCNQVAWQLWALPCI